MLSLITQKSQIKQARPEALFMAPIALISAALPRQATG